MNKILSFVRDSCSDILWSIGLVLLTAIWMGFAPVWYDWYALDESGKWMKCLYDLLDGRWLVNVPVCIIVTCLTAYWCSRIWKDADIRFYRPLISMFGLVVLYWCNTVEYAKVLWQIDYRHFLTLCCVASILTMLVKVIAKWVNAHSNEARKNDNSKESVKGFSDDNTNLGDIPESLKKYAEEIANRLLVTNIEKHSYALGVTGEWGVGKTTFLGVLKKVVENRVEVVEFNPWMCSSPEQVTSDFFASLRHQLSPKYSTLSRSIKEYAKYVNNVTLSHSVFSLEMMLPIRRESLFEKKKALSQKFARLPRPIVVIIDDIDRLERDEVFEVLRLIRNTADLSNVIYMVAYDKEYVTCVLEERNIKDSSAYLEKIFPVEVHLPKVEEHLVWKILKAEIEAQSLSGKAFADELFKRFDLNDKELILKVLDNYRRAKRFARLYMLNVSYVSQQARGELKLLDMFWLELLQMYDKKTYDVLSEDVGILLYRNDERFYMRDGISGPATDKDKNKFAGKPFWKEVTPNILENLFGRYIRIGKQSACFAENYDKYFTMSVSEFRLSIQETNQLFADDVNVEEQIAKWLAKGKYLTSITYQLRQINANILNDDNLKKLIFGILGFILKVAPNHHNYRQEVKKMLRRERYAKGVDKKVHDFVLEWFEKTIKTTEVLLLLGQELHYLYNTIVIGLDGNEDGKHSLIITNEEIEQLLVKVMQVFLSVHTEITAVDLLKETGPLPTIFKSCCVTVREDIDSENCEYKQVAFDTVINHFAQREQKLTVLDYNDALCSLFSQETPVFDNSYEEEQYWDFASDIYEYKMREYFGNSYKHKLEEFKAKCFVEEQPVILVSPVIAEPAD